MSNEAHYVQTPIVRDEDQEKIVNLRQQLQEDINMLINQPSTVEGLEIIKNAAKNASVAISVGDPPRSKPLERSTSPFWKQ